VLVGLNIVFVK